MAKLLTLMYHRVHDPINQLPTEHFKKHLEDLTQKYNIVVPGDNLDANILNICLTFDDAYCDFYGVVYPLLKQLNIKAILAVTVGYVVDDTQLALSERYLVPYPKGMDAQTCQEKVPFCTFKELKEMQQSGHVILASHGFYHASQSDNQTNFEQEVIQSKQLLEQKLNTNIDYFIYPFGDFTRDNHKKITQHYKLAFRIGSALNKTFESHNKMVYRVDADPFWQHKKALEPHLSKWNRKYWMNRIRFK